MDKPEEEQQLTDNNTADPMSFAYRKDCSEVNIKAAKKADRLSHSGRVNDKEITFACDEQQKDKLLQTYYCSDAGMTLQQREGGSETNVQYSFLNIIIFHSQFYITLSTNLV
jgi:hypothetical protein